MLAKFLGSRVAEYVLLALYHYNEAHAALLARDSGFALSAVQSRLQRFENAGLLVSKMAGRTRLYLFNPKSPYTTPVKSLVQVAYETLPLKDREKLFCSRSRPRRPGKPVVPRP